MEMSLHYIAVSAVCLALSVAGLQWWVLSFLSRNGLGLGEAGRAVDVLLGSNVTIALLVNLAVNAYILLVLCLKVSFLELAHIAYLGLPVYFQYDGVI